jgi:hypothetical protein
LVLPPKEKFYLFLLAGQSNMAGRGTVEAEDLTPHPRVLTLNKIGQWVPAVDPIHFDKPVAGVGLGKTFAKLIAEANPDVTIGLVPCAVGGSPIDSWTPGVLYPVTNTFPWDDMAKRVEIAGGSGMWKGILWHQGEADSTPALAPTYEPKLHDLIARLRMLLGAPDLPFIAGQMGKFPDAPWNQDKITVDRAHKELPTRVPHAAFVSAEGLTDRGDKVHFDSASYRELGTRYAAACLSLLKAP